MYKHALVALFILCFFTAHSQTNITISNSLADSILKGTYNPADFEAQVTINNPKIIISELNSSLSKDSLKAHLTKLVSFKNRNMLSASLPNGEGIDNAMNWINSKFQEFSSANESRLIPFFMNFDDTIVRCDTSGSFKNACAILPGSDPTNKSIIIVEAHADSRCEDVCDINCEANGADDNGSGTVLVMELARVLSKYTFDQSIVFMATTGEEQGLLGATAFAEYVDQNNIEVEAVFNNDIVGGIICGETASAPGCPGLNDIDSVNMRIYSFGNLKSPYKQLARFTKLQYNEEYKKHAEVFTQINIISQEDRTGRGGDHIPFRQRGITSIRLTCANEHGDASPDSTYKDRQHTSADIIGKDTNGDDEVDSFFVDFGYLKRNVIINAVSIITSARNNQIPEYTTSNNENGITFTVTSTHPREAFKLGVRQFGNDWIFTHSFEGNSVVCPNLLKDENYYISLASVDSFGVESLFSEEEFFRAAANGPLTSLKLESSGSTIGSLEMLAAHPNPFDESTFITVVVLEPLDYTSSNIVIYDVNGKLVKTIPINLSEKLNQIEFHHGFIKNGMYTYSLVVDDKIISTKKLIFNGNF